MSRRHGIGQHVGEIARGVYRERPRVGYHSELSRHSFDVSRRNHAGRDSVGRATIRMRPGSRLTIVIQAAFYRTPGQLDKLEVLSELVRDESLVSYAINYRETTRSLPDRVKEA